MKRLAIFLYGVVCYAICLGTFGYIAGFLGNFLVPRSIDSPSVGPLGEALLVNTHSRATVARDSRPSGGQAIRPIGPR
jgi:hypothetical protein